MAHMNDLKKKKKNTQSERSVSWEMLKFLISPLIFVFRRPTLIQHVLSSIGDKKNLSFIFILKWILHKYWKSNW